MSIRIPVEEQNRLIAEVCDEFKAFLLDKNIKYGGSALSPVRLASKLSPVEQIEIRIDDKLSRIMNGDPNKEDEDPWRDLLGYLILREAARRMYPKKKAMEDLTDLELDIAIDRAIAEEEALGDTPIINQGEVEPPEPPKGTVDSNDLWNLLGKPTGKDNNNGEKS